MEAKLCYIGHGLMENRSGLLVDARLTRVSGHAERLAALDMIQALADRPVAITLGADKGYDAADFVEELRTMNVRPHVAQNTNGRRSTRGLTGLAMGGDRTKLFEEGYLYYAVVPASLST